MNKSYFSTKNIAGIAVFSALSFLLYLPIFELPIFSAVPFLKLDFTNVFVLLGGFMYGTYGGIFILLFKELLHIPLGSTGGIGELVNIIVGLSYILIPTITYKYKKGIKVVILTLIFAIFSAVIVAIFTNKFINFPLYDKLFNIYEIGITFESTFWYLIAFNFIKFTVVSVLVFVLYKRLSYFFKKINLKENK